MPFYFFDFLIVFNKIIYYINFLMLLLLNIYNFDLKLYLNIKYKIDS